MMRITFKYFAQIRKQAGTETETVVTRDGATVLEALNAIDHGDGFRSIVFDESGAPRSVIMLIVNDLPVATDHVLCDGDQVQLFSPVAGG